MDVEFVSHQTNSNKSSMQKQQTITSVSVKKNLTLVPQVGITKATLLL